MALEAEHATIETNLSEGVASHKQLHSTVTPVRATARPFKCNASTLFQAYFSHLQEVPPKYSEDPPVLCDLCTSLGIAMKPIKVLPLAASGTRKGAKQHHNRTRRGHCCNGFGEPSGRCEIIIDGESHYLNSRWSEFADAAVTTRAELHKDGPESWLRRHRRLCWCGARLLWLLLLLWRCRCCFSGAVVAVIVVAAAVGVAAVVAASVAAAATVVVVIAVCAV